MRIAQIMKSAINLSVSTSHVDWRISTAATSANSSLKATKIKREKLSKSAVSMGLRTSHIIIAAPLQRPPKSRTPVVSERRIDGKP
jgi:hypothetical protein